MDFQAFYKKWLTEPASTIADESLAGVKPYTATALVKRYLIEVYDVKPEYWGTIEEWWSKPNPNLTKKFEQLETQDTDAGDIVFMIGDGGIWHVAIATGKDNLSQIEVLEQNGANASGDGLHDDAIRTRYVQRSTVVGVFRSKELVQLPEAIEHEAEAKRYVLPQGALKVPLHRVEYKIITELNGYGYMSHAQTGDKPVQRLKVGNYYMTRQQAGMAQVDTGEGTKSFWINPADNIVRPKISNFRPDTRSDYHWFKGGNAGEPRPLLYQATGDYMKRNKSGFVFSFKADKENRAIRYKDLIYIAGTFRDDDHLYGVPAFERDDGSFGTAPSYGVLMSYLELSQEDYQPEEDLIQDVQPAEAAALVPVRRVSVKDQVTLVKAHGQKFIDGFIKKV